ncbi:MAG: NAD(P)-binding domain-containing protein [Anaerolineales bacterium]
MKIGVIGAGNIGGTIGKKWAEQGHEVIFGLRDPSSPKYQELLEAIDGEARTATIAEAVEQAEAILFAIPSSAMEETAAILGNKLDGKIILDATNKFSQAVANSLATLQKHAPQAKLFRAFNYLGWENFAEPFIGDTQADLFYCGNAGEAQHIVEKLISDVGIRPVYLGDLDQAPVLDALLRLWVTLAVQQGKGRHLAFKMLKE